MSERMLKIAEVEDRVGRKKSWIYAEVNAGRFPASDEGLWFLSEVNRYLRLRRVGGSVAGVWPERPKKAA